MRDMALHIMDIAQNSIYANAKSIGIEIIENKDDDSYTVIVVDDGGGMSQEMVSKVTDPYVTTRTTRKTGLGIPLLKLNAERTGGSFQIESEEGKGTTVRAEFVFTHPDRIPAGDIAGIIVLLIAANPGIAFRYQHVTNKGKYAISTAEINETLEGVSISEPAVARFLKEMIRENQQQILIS